MKPIISAMPQKALETAQIKVFWMKLNPKNVAAEMEKRATNVSKIFKEKKFFLKETLRMINLIVLDIIEEATSPIGAANSVNRINESKTTIKVMNLTMEAMKFSFSLPPINRIVPHVL